MSAARFSAARSNQSDVRCRLLVLQLRAAWCVSPAWRDSEVFADGVSLSKCSDAANAGCAKKPAPRGRKRAEVSGERARQQAGRRCERRCGVRQVSRKRADAPRSEIDISPSLSHTHRSRSTLHADRTSEERVTQHAGCNAC
eukprot:122973-Rhodomonas_salina.1